MSMPGGEYADLVNLETNHRDWPPLVAPFKSLEMAASGQEIVPYRPLSLDSLELDLHTKPNFEEFFIKSTQQGLNDAEFSAIMKYISSSNLCVRDKKKLLDTAVPISLVPEKPFRDLLLWLFSNIRTVEITLVVHILKWVIDLLDNGLVSSDVVTIFYFDLYVLLDYHDLYKYVCVLLCKLTKSKDVTRREVMRVTNKYEKYKDSKGGQFLLSLLQVFKGFKPHLLPDPLKSVDIEKTFNTVKSGNLIVKIAYRRCIQQNKTIVEIPTSEQIKYNDINPVSKLIPCPAFKIDEDNLSEALSFPDHIEGAFALLKKPKPSIENTLSYLRDETGFFMLLNAGDGIFDQFSVNLFQKLQEVFISQTIQTSDDDKELFLIRIYEFQAFIQQGIPLVSQFLAGYFMQWDGIDYRPEILKLLEWVVFDDFKWLSANILRPFYMLFVTSNATMKQQIIRGFTNLLKNMFAAIEEKESYHPLKKWPLWVYDQVSILSSLTKWVEQIIRIGLSLEKDDRVLLESVHFYETINALESRSKLPLWTVIPRGVVFRTSFNHTPVILNRVCRLIRIYHNISLPNLRAYQPEFYKGCKDKLCGILKCTEELIAMWIGEEENQRYVSKETLLSNLSKNFKDKRFHPDDLKILFDLSHNANWLPYVIYDRNQNGPNLLKRNEDHLISLEYHLEHIAKFIMYFSPKNG